MRGGNQVARCRAATATYNSVPRSGIHHKAIGWLPRKRRILMAGTGARIFAVVFLPSAKILWQAAFSGATARRTARQHFGEKATLCFAVLSGARSVLLEPRAIWPWVEGASPVGQGRSPARVGSFAAGQRNSPSRLERQVADWQTSPRQPPCWTGPPLLPGGKM